MPRRRRKSSIQCPNCGTALHEGDHFCRHCGQENHDLRVPFRHFAYEFVESITHFDTKLWSTLKMIFTRPGQLTKDFVEGKRARYVKPAQFYVFVSIVFFALLAWTIDRDIERDPDQKPARQGSSPWTGLYDALPDSMAVVLAQDSVALRRIEVPITAPRYRAMADSWHTPTRSLLDSLLKQVHKDTVAGFAKRLPSALASLPSGDHLELPYSNIVNGRVVLFNNKEEERHLRDRLPDFTDAQVDSLLIATGTSKPQWLERKLFRAVGNADGSSVRGQKQIAHAVVKAVSFIMFLLMPFTAVLLLWIFYRTRYYWEHLIFSVHMHTIFFLFFSILLGVGLLLPDGIASRMVGAMAVVCLVYLLLSLRRVYGKSWGATLLRTFVMCVPYLFVFSLLMLIGVVWGFFSL